MNAAAAPMSVMPTMTIDALRRGLSFIDNGTRGAREVRGVLSLALERPIGRAEARRLLDQLSPSDVRTLLERRSAAIPQTAPPSSPIRPRRAHTMHESTPIIGREDRPGRPYASATITEANEGLRHALAGNYSHPAVRTLVRVAMPGGSKPTREYVARAFKIGALDAGLLRGLLRSRGLLIEDDALASEKVTA